MIRHRAARDASGNGFKGERTNTGRDSEMARSSKSSIIPILFILISAILPALAQVTYTWNAASADWDSAASWLPAGVPGPQDTAIINSGAATLNRDAQVGGFILNAGILTGGGSLRVSGAMNWAGGRLEGSDSVMVAAGGALAITNAVDIEVNGKVLHLAGNGSWSGNGKLRLKNGAVVSTAAGATFALQSNAILEMSTGGGSIRNSGVFTKTAGGAATDLTAPLINQGTVSVFSGTLQLKGGGSASGGVFETGNGNVLVFSGGTHDLDGVNFTGGGTVQFPDATINALGGGITVGNGVSADLSGSNGKIQGGGPVTINGTLIWNRGIIGSAGSLTINGSLLLAGTFPKTLDGRSLANHGAVTWSGSGALRLQNNAVLANQAGGIFELQADALLDFIDPVGGIFTNAGAFTKSGGVSFATLDVSLANTGILNINSGTLKLARGSDLGGTIQVAANSVLEFDGGVHTLNNAAVAGEGLLQQTSGTVNTSGAGASIASPATFLLQGGLLGGDGPLAVNGAFRWSGGTISGTGALFSNNVLSIEGNAIKILDGRTLTNAGSGSWSGIGELRLRNSGILLNQAGGTFDVQTDAILNYLTPNGGTVQNSGAFSKSAGTGATSINVLLVNNGTLGINSGSIKLAKGSSSAGGTFTVAPGSLLDLSGDVHNFDNTLFDGGGSVQINNAVVNVSGAGLTVAPSAALTMIQSGSILQGSGPVIINGTFTWDRGTLTGSGGFTVNGVLNLTGTFSKFLDGKTLTNAGMLKWIDPGGLRLSNNAAIVNQAGAVFDIQTDATLQFLAPGGTLSNFGTLLKSGGAGAATLNAPYANNGEFSVNSGTLRLANGGSGSGGTFNVAAGCVLEFDGGVHNLENATFDGGGAVQLTSNTVNVSGSGAIFTPPLTLNLAGGIFSGTAPIIVNGVFNWTRGTITGSGAFTVNNLFNISGDNFKSLDGRTLTNAGTAAWSGNGELRMFNQAVLLNQAGATFDMLSNAAMKYSTPLGGSVANAGTMRKTGGGAISNIEVALDNSGILEVQNGTLAFWSTLFNAASGTIGGSGTLDVSHAVFSSQGSLNPGASPGILTVIGDYAQHAPGQLNIELGGLVPGSGYDRLAVSDSAQIGGQLNLAYTNGFVPAVGDEFTVLTYGIRNGVFSGITHPTGGVTFTADYTPSGVLLHTIRTNIVPSANDDNVSTDEDVALNINVLANDSDGDGDILSISGFTQPQHGEAAQTGDSTLSYLPALNFFGADSFRYFVIDGYGGSDTATVRITVLPVNDPPVISSPLPEVSFPEDSSATLNLTPYASDVDNSVEELSWSAQVIAAQFLSATQRNALPNYEAELRTIARSVPAFRDRNEKSSPNLQSSMFNLQSSTEVDPEDLQIVIDPATGVAAFSATLDSSGVFTVVFTLSDPGGLSDSDTITVTVTAVGDPPFVANPIADLEFAEDSGPAIAAANLHEVFSDPDPGTVFSFSAVSDNPDILPEVQGAGLAVSSSLNFFGAGNVIVSAGDGTRTIVSDTFAVTITPVNDPPVISNIPNVTFPEDSSYSLDLDEWVSDVDNGDSELSWSAQVIAAQGTNSPGAKSVNFQFSIFNPQSAPGGIEVDTSDLQVSIDPLTRLATFTATLDSTGVFTVEFSVSDPAGLGDIDTMLATVTGTNDPPFVVNPIPDLSFPEDSGPHLAAADLNTVFFDPDPGSAFVFTAQSDNPDIQVLIQNDSLWVDATLNYFGNGTAIVSADDGVFSISDTFAVTITPVNDPPAIINLAPAYTIPEDDTLSFDLDTLAADPDDPLPALGWQVDLLSNPPVSDSIQVLHDPFSNEILFIPAPNFSFSGQLIRFSVCDPAGACDVDTVAFDVLPVNDPPVFSGLPDSLSFTADTSATLNLWDFVEDVETSDSLLSFTFAVSSDSLIYSFNPLNGALALMALGNFGGDALLEITVTDAGNASASEDIIVTVIPLVGIAPLAGGEIPREFALQQNYPNPFNPDTRIKFQLPSAQAVTLTIYNVLGQKVRTLINERLEAGYYEAVWNGLNEQGQALASGVYLYRMEAGDYRTVRRMVLLK